MVISKTTQKTSSDLMNKFAAKNLGSFVKDDIVKNQPSSENNKAKEAKASKSTASKLLPLKQGNELIDMLMKVYSFMQKNYDEDKLQREKANNFKEESLLEDEKRHLKLLKALKNLKGGDIQTADKLENDTGMGIAGIVGSVLDAFGGGKTALSLMNNIGKFFIFSPVGAGLLLGLSVLSLLKMDKNPEETNKMLQGAMGGPSADAQTIMDVVANTSDVERRKQQILANRPSSKKSMLFWRDPELQNKYLEELGFDENTGLTKAEKEQGYTGLDDKGLPTKTSPTSLTSPVNTPKAQLVTPATSSVESVTPTSPNSITPSISATTSSPAERLIRAQAENNSVKLEDSIQPSVSTINNVVAGSSGKTNNVMPAVSVPSVRNSESTFQDMIYYSTRVV